MAALPYRGSLRRNAQTQSKRMICQNCQNSGNLNRYEHVEPNEEPRRQMELGRITRCCHSLGGSVHHKLKGVFDPPTALRQTSDTALILISANGGFCSRAPISTKKHHI